MNPTKPATLELLSLGNDAQINDQRAAQIKSIFLMSQTSKETKRKVSSEAAPTETMRERILKLSLFPTIYR
jgi:hypothetical protein